MLLGIVYRNSLRFPPGPIGVILFDDYFQCGLIHQVPSTARSNILRSLCFTDTSPSTQGHRRQGKQLLSQKNYVNYLSSASQPGLYQRGIIGREGGEMKKSEDTKAAFGWGIPPQRDPAKQK
jgi:hypothetical protein